MPLRGAQKGTYGCLLPVSASSYLELSQRANTSGALLSGDLTSEGAALAGPASVGFASMVVSWPEASVETTGVTVESVPSLSTIESQGVGAAEEEEEEEEEELLSEVAVDSARATFGTAAAWQTSRRSGRSEAAIMVDVFLLIFRVVSAREGGEGGGQRDI